MSLRPESLSAKDLDTILGWRQRSHTFIKIQAMLIHQKEEMEFWHRRFK